MYNVYIYIHIYVYIFMYIYIYIICVCAVRDTHTRSSSAKNVLSPTEKVVVGGLGYFESNREYWGVPRTPNPKETNVYNGDISPNNYQS